MSEERYGKLEANNELPKQTFSAMNELIEVFRASVLEHNAPSNPAYYEWLPSEQEEVTEKALALIEQISDLKNITNDYLVESFNKNSDMLGGIFLSHVFNSSTLPKLQGNIHSYIVGADLPADKTIILEKESRVEQLGIEGRGIVINKGNVEMMSANMNDGMSLNFGYAITFGRDAINGFLYNSGRTGLAAPGAEIHFVNTGQFDEMAGEGYVSGVIVNTYERAINEYNLSSGTLFQFGGTLIPDPYSAIGDSSQCLAISARRTASLYHKGLIEFVDQVALDRIVSDTRKEVEKFEKFDELQESPEELIAYSQSLIPHYSTFIEAQVTALEGYIAKK